MSTCNKYYDLEGNELTERQKQEITNYWREVIKEIENEQKEI